MRRTVNVEGLFRLPAFSHATVAGDHVYVSGALGTTGDSDELAPGGTGPETLQALRNIERILAACEATLDNVVKVSVFLADMATGPAMNEAYLSVFTGDRPARITVGGVGLALGAAVEMDCIAYRGS
ncbi:MAG TPA: RidA family protein [Acidimicrobiales bacterium]|jgi:2-iminobutanoate/2-iminopropanoate deaminase